MTVSSFRHVILRGRISTEYDANYRTSERLPQNSDWLTRRSLNSVNQNICISYGICLSCLPAAYTKFDKVNFCIFLEISSKLGDRPYCLARLASLERDSSEFDICQRPQINLRIAKLLAQCVG